MKGMAFVGLIVLVSMMTGCHYYQEYRQMKGTADIQEERAELMKAQRECLQKYEDDPQAVERRCGMYTDMLPSRGTNRGDGS